MAPLPCFALPAAVAGGQRVGNPGLEVAAHGLAALIVSGRAPGQRLIRIAGYSGLALGVACVAVGIVVIARDHRSVQAAFLLPDSLIIGTNAWIQLLWGPRRQRRQATRALELNRQAAPA